MNSIQTGLIFTIIDLMPGVELGAEQVGRLQIGFVTHFRTRMDVKAHVVFAELRTRPVQVLNEGDFAQRAVCSQREEAVVWENSIWSEEFIRLINSFRSWSYLDRRRNRRSSRIWAEYQGRRPQSVCHRASTADEMNRIRTAAHSLPFHAAPKTRNTF